MLKSFATWLGPVRPRHGQTRERQKRERRVFGVSWRFSIKTGVSAFKRYSQAPVARTPVIPIAPVCL